METGRIAAALRLRDGGSEASEVLRVMVQGKGTEGRERLAVNPVKESVRVEILGADAGCLRHVVSISRKATGSQV